MENNFLTIFNIQGNLWYKVMDNNLYLMLKWVLKQDNYPLTSFSNIVSGFLEFLVVRLEGLLSLSPFGLIEKYL